MRNKVIRCGQFISNVSVDYTELTFLRFTGDAYFVVFLQQSSLDPLLQLHLHVVSHLQFEPHFSAVHLHAD